MKDLKEIRYMLMGLLDGMRDLSNKNTLLLGSPLFHELTVRADDTLATVERMLLNEEQEDPPRGVLLPEDLGKRPFGVAIDGYSTMTGKKADPVIVLDRDPLKEDRIHIYIWGNIHKEYPTHTICLDGAKESRRGEVVGN